MKLLKLLSLLIFLSMSGCAGVMDYSLAPAHVELSSFNRSQSKDVQIYKPKGRQEFLSPETIKDLNNGYLTTKHVRVQNEGKVIVDFPNEWRGGLFWIIPPLGSMFIDTSDYFIFMSESKVTYGVVVDGQEISIYKADSNSTFKRSVDPSVLNLFKIESQNDSVVKLVYEIHS